MNEVIDNVTLPTIIDVSMAVAMLVGFVRGISVATYLYRGTNAVSAKSSVKCGKFLLKTGGMMLWS